MPRPKIVDVFPRLEKEDLLAWARVLFEEQRAVQAKQELAHRLLLDRGFIPGEYLLSNDGYIISQEEFQKRVVRSGPSLLPDTETSEPDHHTDVKAVSER